MLHCGLGIVDVALKLLVLFRRLHILEKILVLLVLLRKVKVVDNVIAERLYTMSDQEFLRMAQIEKARYPLEHTANHARGIVLHLTFELLLHLKHVHLVQVLWLHGVRHKLQLLEESES
jgi:hypothetical protein